MGAVALYTFGVLDPGIEPAALADFSRRGTAIFALSEEAPGFLGQADADTDAPHRPGADFGPWGVYVLPLGLPDFAGHDPHVHIATLSLWEDVPTAREFVYRGMHRDALRHRYEWFVKGPWPGHVLWETPDAALPTWTDGVGRLEALARDGETAEHFTFGSALARA